MLLEILTWVNDYNYNMNSVDLANQFQQPYDTQQIAYCTWILLFHWILDQAAINAYKLALVAGTWTKKEGHLKFRRALYKKLLDYSVDSKPWREPGPHNWVDRLTRQSCALCCKRERLKKKFISQQEEIGIEVFKADNKPLPRSSSGCGYCNVALCKKSSCFQDWHNQKGQISG